MTGERPLRVLAYPAFKNRRVNPYNWLLSQALIARGVRVRECDRPRLLSGDDDIWHLHWPEGAARLNGDSSLVGAFRAGGLILMLRWGRWRGKRIVWTVHNLESHERRHPRLEAWFWTTFSRLVDGFIALSDHGARAVRERFVALRNAPGFVIPHGHYRDVYPGTVSRSEARQALNIGPGTRVLAYLGQIRPYKNVGPLITEFRGLPDPDLLLLVGGSPINAQLADELREAAGDDTRIRLDLRFLPDDDIQRYVSASDLVALPYRDILNSGSAILALSLNRPVLVPRTGAFGELQMLVGRDWVYTYDGALAASHIEDALGRVIGSARAAVAPLQTMDWDHIARATVDAYTAILNRGPALRDTPIPASGLGISRR